jgi:hypothetical protein
VDDLEFGLENEESKNDQTLIKSIEEIPQEAIDML